MTLPSSWRLARAIGLRGLAFGALWWVLTGGGPGAWGVPGAVAVITALAASLRLQPPSHGTLRVSVVPWLLAAFCWNSLRGGLQVARLALQRRPALRPAFVEVTLTLPEGGPRVLLVSAIGLMPGTLGLHLDGARLRLHVLDATQPVTDDVRRLEGHLAALFGAAP